MTYSVAPNSGVDYISGSILHLDLAYLTTNYNITVDIGYIIGAGGIMSATGIQADHLMTNFITTYTSFIIRKTGTVSFSLLSKGNISLIQGTYDFLNASYINVRQ